MKLSPLKINLLMHIYSIAEPFDHPDAPAYVSAKREFLEHNLIFADHDFPCGYKLTPRGKAFIKMILATPLPEEQLAFIDPRTGNPV